MKKIVVTLMILCTAPALKAQQLPVSPWLPLTKFKLMPDSLNKRLSFKFNDSLRSPLARPEILATNDRMPVVSPRIGSNMPIVQTDRTGYTMPVLGKRLPDVYYMKRPGIKIAPLQP